ncbi:type I-F CRISPR-associated endoribonuclease Cas6/Csy4 [Desulfonatronum sp. SC1]|uniref:type I-F CRISPR-associated endoribonuclease Cas6/Csy4 n=1 Tax=Desulfonatronum sp. SC1 TaxID=2109626 RepID=UPI000D31B71E|nr:type I-F CRISPR-associated endoribonuclease Cas6/Csy4 [Desulfonatronum sp. SC1]PTN35185.1 type I-F CRISPR-associated endoribonuclease Cas6/Csy4 [Desulfonatronum sp. SC1]
MRKYVQITLIPDEVSGVTGPVLMSHVMQALHNHFVRIKDSRDSVPFGVSFPEYDENKPTLGDKVYVHGWDKDFSSKDIPGALSNLRDYLHVTSPRLIPGSRIKGYVAYSRLRHDHGKEKLMRRRMRRHGVTREEAEEYYADYQQDFFPDGPFVLIRSTSTGNNTYPFYIRRLFLDSPGEGKFNTFGINPAAGVEYF